MHMHVVNMINMDASMSVAICKFLYMYTCVCAHVCACACMFMCVGTPPCPQMPPNIPHPPASSPELQGTQNTKIQ